MNSRILDKIEKGNFEIEKKNNKFFNISIKTGPKKINFTLNENDFNNNQAKFEDFKNYFNKLQNLL